MKHSKKSSKSSKSLDQRLENYADNAKAKLALGGSSQSVLAFSAAAGAALAMAPAAEGAIVTSGPGFTPVTKSVGDLGNGYLGITGLGGLRLQFTAPPAYTSGVFQFNIYQANLLNYRSATGGVNIDGAWAIDGANANRFALGDVIGDDESFSSSQFNNAAAFRSRIRTNTGNGDQTAEFQTGDWFGASNGYAGFRVTRSDTGQTNYGWASITVLDTNANGAPNSITVNSWAYQDTPGATIQAGIPEPSEIGLGLGLLALGAAGIRRHRKLKRERDAATKQKKQ